MCRLLLGAAVILATLGSTRSSAVELLFSGNFEPPVGFTGILGWDLEQFITGSPHLNTVTAELVPGSNETAPNQLFLLSFSGNGALGFADGNFDNDFLPAGDVDGFDFLEWQRGNSPTPNSAADLATWEGNYGRQGGRLANAILSQTVDVAGAVGQTFTFSGYARWEDNYSGGVATLDASSPLGAVPSPTTNSMKLQFLDSVGGLISEESIDLAMEGQFNLNFWQQHTVQGVAPNGTTKVRVVADGRNMVFNTDPGGQAAFYDSFALTGDDPNIELLTNPGLDAPAPTALDFWELTEGPTFIGSQDILRVGNYQNHTPGGTTSAWLSSFFGGGHLRVFNWPEGPVFGTMAQTVAIVAGETYDFSGWSYFELNYSGGVDTIGFADPGPLSLYAGQESPTKTQITLEFLDPNGAVLSTSTIDVKADRLDQIGCDPNCSNNAANNQTWYQHTLTGVVAPGGAVSARLSGKMIDGVFNVDPFQAAFFDDFSLTGPAPLLAASNAVPEPSTVAGLAVGALMLSLGRSRRRIA